MSELKAGKYQTYPEYRKVVSEWLSKIPQSWTISTLKHVARINMGQSPSSEDCNIEGIGIPFLQGNAEFGIKTPLEKQYCPIPKKIALEGELLFSVRAPVGALNLANKSFGIGRGLCSIRGNDSLSQSFLWWVLPSYKYQFDAIATGSTFEAISAEQVGNLSFALPNNEEQTQIANFLDHETAKIDTLIKKQQQLIKLLKEKRQAVISHAVTKGIPNKEHPNVPMKDSGVEWLGEVPEHWVVAQLKFNTRLVQTGPFGSQLHAEDYVEDGVPLINPAHMLNGIIMPDKQVTVDLETQERLCRHKLSEGDIIFARRGELGRCAVVQKEQVGWLCGTGSLKATLNERLIPEYAYLLITSDGVISELSLESKGSTMDNLNTETLGKIRTPVPPVGEQQAILEYVDTVSGKYKLLIDKAYNAIELIKERRTALISAAVSGKIDVRHWEQPND